MDFFMTDAYKVSLHKMYSSGEMKLFNKNAPKVEKFRILAVELKNK